MIRELKGFALCVTTRVILAGRPLRGYLPSRCYAGVGWNGGLREEIERHTKTVV